MTFELSVPSFLILEIISMSNFSWQKTLERRNNAVKVKNSFLIVLWFKEKGRYNHFYFLKEIEDYENRVLCTPLHNFCLDDCCVAHLPACRQAGVAPILFNKLSIFKTA